MFMFLIKHQVKATGFYLVAALILPRTSSLKVHLAVF